MRVVAVESVTLDGVMQAPAGPTRTGAAAFSTAAGPCGIDLLSQCEQIALSPRPPGHPFFGAQSDHPPTHVRPERNATNEPYVATVSAPSSELIATSIE